MYSSLSRRLALLVTSLLLLPAFASAQTTDVLVVTPVPSPDGNGTLANVIHEVGFPDDGLNRSYGAVLNDAGQVVFPGYLTGTAGGQNADDSGLFLIDDDDGELVQLIRAGDPSPDGNGVFYYYSWTNVPSLNSDGRTALHQLMTQSDSGDLFEWAGITVGPTGQDPEVFLRENGPGPGGEETVQSFSTMMLTNNGLLGFSGLFEAPDPVGAPVVFRGDVTTGDIEIVAREDDVPPDGNGYFNLLSLPDINEAGQMVFFADIGGSDELDDEGLYFVEADGTTIRQIARVGDPTPGGGVVYGIDSGSKTVINELGQVVYTYFSAPCGNCVPDTQHLFRYDPDTDESVELLRTGTPSPDGGLWYGFKNVRRAGSRPALNDAGQIAFHGETARGGLIFTGFYRTDGTETIRITDNGEPTPSGDGYFLITSLSAPHGWDSRDVPKMNERGQVAFFTNLRDTDDDRDRQGIFFYDDELGLMEVARTHDEVLGSHVRELRFIDDGAAPHDNARSGLNNLGQVAYAFQLDDGRSGIALWTPPQIPVSAESPARAPGVFAVESVYPNPFGNATTLRLSLPAEAAVELVVYDVLGRRVLRRNLGQLTTGKHRVELKGATLAPGIYVAHVTAEDGAAAAIRLVKAE